MDELELQESFDAMPATLYEAWIDADLHAAFTGAPATSEARLGGHFTAWDGYIEGTHVELQPGARIVQRWRTGEFPEGAPDSLLEVTLQRSGDGSVLHLRHTGLPAGDGPRYAQGWRDHYFEPLHAWLSQR